jgi:hypothetical protein
MTFCVGSLVGGAFPIHTDRRTSIVRVYGSNEVLR